MATTLETCNSVQGVSDPVSVKAIGELEGKYLTFLLGDEEYGLEVLNVREIIGIMEITQVPQTPGFVRGVINLRGQVIPVVDLRLRFGLEKAQYTDQTCIVVVEVGILMGIIVDAVQEVLTIPAVDIEPAPKLEACDSTDSILGMGKVNDDVKILLDIEEVLRSEELVQLDAEETARRS